MSAHSDDNREVRRAELLAKLNIEIPYRTDPFEPICRFCGWQPEVNLVLGGVLRLERNVGYACADRFSCAARLAAIIRRNASLSPSVKSA